VSFARSTDGTRIGALVTAMRDRFGHLVHELAKFGVIGAFAYIVDVSTFNALRSGPLADRPLTAKFISTVVATTVAYFGNRHWTFRHRERTGLRREYALFFAFNAVGLAIALGCLGFSHYLLGLTSPLADNISANVVGMALGTIFRFWTYRRWVFTEVLEPTTAELAEPLAA
jgi:putative flippase GtrA